LLNCDFFLFFSHGGQCGKSAKEMDVTSRREFVPTFSLSSSQSTILAPFCSFPRSSTSIDANGRSTDRHTSSNRRNVTLGRLHS